MSGGVVSGQFTEALADYLAEWFSNGAKLPREELVRDAQGIADALLASGAVREEAAVRAEALREAAEDLRVNAARAWGGSASWLTTGSHVAELAADWLTESADDLLAPQDPA